MSIKRNGDLVLEPPNLPKRRKQRVKKKLQFRRRLRQRDGLKSIAAHGSTGLSFSTGMAVYCPVVMIRWMISMISVLLKIWVNS